MSIWIHALNTFRYSEYSRMLLDSIVHSNRLHDMVYIFLYRHILSTKELLSSVLLSLFVASQYVRLRYMVPVHAHKIEIALPKRKLFTLQTKIAIANVANNTAHKNQTQLSLSQAI